MPRDNQRNTRQSSRSSGGRAKQQKYETEYLPILTLFSNENRDGSRSIQIKAYDTTNGSIEDVLTKEQFLHICGKLYDGDVTLSGRLWESDSEYADMSGNIRLTETDDPKAKYTLSSMLADFGEKKTRQRSAKAKAKPPEYSVPEEDEDGEEYTEEDGDALDDF